MDIKDFIIAGHSLGGYIAGNYAVKYPQNVRKLLMFGPVGIRKMLDGENWEQSYDKRAALG